MRTTVTLSPDVAAAVQAQRRERGIGVSEAVNDLIRSGISTQPPTRPTPAIPGYDLGRELIDISNVQEALSLAEGIDRR